MVGEGRVAATPDRWILVAAVNAMADSASEALTRVSQLVTSATAALSEAGIGQSLLRTQNLFVHDFFDQTERRVTARVASYELEVTTGSVDELSSAVSSPERQPPDTWHPFDGVRSRPSLRRGPGSGGDRGKSKSADARCFLRCDPWSNPLHRGAADPWCTDPPDFSHGLSLYRWAGRGSGYAY